MDDFVNGHITQQAHFVFTPSGDSTVDYIARTEHISRDWLDILELVRQRTGLPVPRVAIPEPHRDTAGVPAELRHACLAPKVVALHQLDATSGRAIAMQYAMDMHLFRFWPRGAVASHAQLPDDDAAAQAFFALLHDGHQFAELDGL